MSPTIRVTTQLQEDLTPTPSSQSYDVTLTTQSSSAWSVWITHRIERYPVFHYMLMRWTGSDMGSILIVREVSVGLFLTPSDKLIYDKFISESSLPERLHFTIFMAESKDQYPINHLRNLAIEGVRTSHLWLTDMDMWPSCISSLPLPRRQSPRGADGAPG